MTARTAGGGPLDDVVGRGTLLAGRYRLERPVRGDLPGTSVWDGRDEVLDRAARVTVVVAGPIGHILDAARRAALVVDPRLVRIYDVGETDGAGYVVTEAVLGPSLAELTASGPILAAEARALVGEAAAALETARRRGVHHLALRPSVLHRTPDGRVLLTGAAVDGTILGAALGDARSTSRTDAVGLVALLYFALTGCWPGPEAPGFRAAPHVTGMPVAPSELVSGVPNDLDTLCAVTFGPHDDGPHSPGELVRDLAPWPAIGAGGLLGTGAPAPPADSTAAMDVASIFAEDDAAPPADSTAAMDVASIFAEDDAAAGFGVEATPSLGPRVVARQSIRKTLATPTAGSPLPGTPPPARPQRRPAVIPLGATAPTSAFGTFAATPDPTSGVPGHGFGSAAGTEAFGPIAATSAPAPQFAPVGISPASGRTATGASAARAGERQRFDPTRWVLLIAVAAVVLGAVLAVKAILAPPTPPLVPAASSSSAQPSQSTEPPPTASTEPSVEPSPSAEPLPGGAIIPIVSAQSLDPPPAGDSNEHPDEAGRAVDGDPATFWRSRTYNQAAMPGKPGIGFAVSFAQPTTVSTVTLHVNGTGGRVEIRATDPSTPMDGAVLAEGAFGPDQTYVLSAPVETGSIVLWITELPQAADGGNRIELNEIQVS